MLNYKIKKGTTNVSVVCRAVDSTDGTPETAFDHTAAGIDLKYRREGAANVDITEVALAALTTVHADGGVEQIGNGYFRLDLPDAACASGIDGVLVHGVATGMVIIGCYIQLVDYDPNDSVRMGMTALPNAAADAAGGLPVSDAGGLPMDDLVQLNATAQTNLEDQYDGTGLSGDTFPATQAQVGNLATGSAAISVVAESDVVTTGTEVNTYAVTDEVDQVYHEITDVAGVMELYYQFDVSGNGVAATVQMTGRLTSANDAIGVYAYNWSGASWDQIGLLSGTGGTTDGISIFSLLTRHTGTGANLGKVRVRGYAASGLTSATLYLDQAIVSYAVVAQSVGYANGAIWFDSNASNTNTEVYVDGTADNPVSTEAAVNTLIASTGLTRVEVAIDSSITFATIHTSEFWTGEHWVCGLGGQDLSSSHFRGADISGIGTGTTAIDFEGCRIGTATIHQFHMLNCGFNGTLTLGEIGNYIISGGHSAIAGSTTPIIDTGAALANVNLTMPDWHNGVEIRNLNAAGADLFSISGIGQIIYASSSSGAVNQRGRWKVTNTGGVTITYDDPSQNEIDTLEDTNELQTDLTNDGRLDLIFDAVLAILDDPRGEPGQGAPAVNADMATKVDYLYKNWRNLSKQTSTTYSLYNDAGSTVDQKSTDSDDTTTATKGEIVSGP